MYRDRQLEEKKVKVAQEVARQQALDAEMEVDRRKHLEAQKVIPCLSCDPSPSLPPQRNLLTTPNHRNDWQVFISSGLARTVGICQLPLPHRQTLYQSFILMTIRSDCSTFCAVNSP